MPRLPASLLALGLGAAAAVALVACGGEDAKLLPGETAREITANLETVKQLAGEGDCIGAESAAQQVSEQIEALTGVDRKLKQALQGGAERLNEVVASCEESSIEAIAPAEELPESEERTPKAEEREAKEFEKAQKQEEKEAATEPEGTKTPPQLPPQSQGEGKGLENGKGPPSDAGEEAQPEVSPSGGVSPGAPAAGGE
jgi:septal ring factor EnvC (AmiA/AmiB activator)